MSYYSDEREGEKKREREREREKKEFEEVCHVTLKGGKERNGKFKNGLQQGS